MTTTSETQKRLQWVCSTVDAEDGARVQASPTSLVPMGMAARGKLWAKGTTLKVGFLEGTPPLHERVMKAFSYWFVQGVQLELQRAAPGTRTHIRVAFDPRRGSWSNVGKDCLTVHPSQPTMNLGWATMDASDEDFFGTVIHEFGHALGLLHEHNHPEARIRWNKDAVYKDLMGEPNDWDRETIDFNVFAKFDASQVITTAFDKASVMIYTIPSWWTTDGKSFMPYWQLSEGDTATIVKLYS